MLKIILRFFNFILTITVLISCVNKPVDESNQEYAIVDSYLTTSDQVYRFTKVEIPSEIPTDVDQLITLDTQIQYQSIDGFGFSLTGGSAQHLMQMSKDVRANLLNELFGIDDNEIGISYLRISLGASDLDEKAFSYNDIPEGTKDLQLEKFSLEEDENDLIPILSEILAINPDIKIMASPWSPPAWMKTNGNTKGGSLEKEYFDLYANYFVKYIRAMADHGISIDAITVQNEPLHPGNNPSLFMTSEDQSLFVKNSLGPIFQKEGIVTKIIIYDHNADRIDYPMAILNDSVARQYVDGSAFHLYGGEISNLSELHDAHPDKNIYFTEQWIGAPGNFTEDMIWHMKNLIIGASRNWCKTVLEWNLSSNPALQPHTDGGCTKCLGALTIDGDNVIRNPAYYIIAHASKFVRPGSKRIYSSNNESLPNVAFLTPDKEIVLIVLNDSGMNQTFAIELAGETSNYNLNSGATVTYVFRK